MANDYKNILIIKPSAMGDIVHALPVLKAVRTGVPAARVTWLVRTEFAPLLKCVEGVDDILLFDRTRLGHWYYRPAAFKALLDFMRTLRKNRYDCVLDLQGLLRTGLFAWITGSPKRIGMANCREFAGLFYTRKVPRPAESLHVLDHYFAVLKQAGFNKPSSTDISFNISKNATASVQQKLEDAGITGPFLVLIPSSAHQSKCWPAERFAALAQKVNEQYGFQIAAVGTAHDKPIVRRIQDHCPIPIADLTGQTGIEELIALFYQAAAVVSNDTGPGYIAAETGTPTVLIYGNVNPRRVAPYRRPECVAAVDPDNRPAGIRSADPAHDVKNVTFETVLQKLNALLNRQPIENS